MRHYNRTASHFLALIGVDASLWATLIVVGLLGCSGNMTAVQCAAWWTTLTAIAVISKIFIGLSLLNPQIKAAQRQEEVKIGRYNENANNSLRNSRGR
jgi:hypothetical protein